ncbi:uncharacterized protein [Primulina huaijiensis]|uniref:uncharacterized protein n=1 Tax=Primulina huaijiensis TaxID=1492673 RepID=UPI003CC6E53F
MHGGDKMAAAVDGGVLVKLELGGAAATFNLEKAVCSHGLFMMAPNHWDPRSKTLQRPLRLGLDDHETSFLVRVSHPSMFPQELHILVLGARSLCPQQRHSLLRQVSRMLRLSEEEDRRVREFQEAHEKAKEGNFGRVFRSPTLFEDMVKCILLCNCQWSRTLSMAQALCDLQWELQHPESAASFIISENGNISSCQTSEIEHIIPKTPAVKEPKRTWKVNKCSKTLVNSYAEGKTSEGYIDLKISREEMSDASHEKGKPSPYLPSSDVEYCDSEQNLTTTCNADCDPSSFQSSEETLVNHCTRSGNFPSPRELAGLDEKFLVQRCKLGYRADRIIKLAQEIVEGKIQLTELEDDCGTLSLADCDKIAEKLKVIKGFGPFTCANVLMCMGFYHIIPTDSETIRHLKQVHAKSCTIHTVERKLELIYGKYAPFQFLAYWSEVWHFYEEWFGNLGEMPRSSYKLITAANMRPKAKNGRSKKQKLE